MLVTQCKDIKEFKKLHAERENDRIPPAESILALDKYCFCFYDEITSKLLGCIYLEDDKNRVCLSGFSKRKNYKNIIEAIAWVSNVFREDDLYALTDKKSAIMVLLRSGFKRIDKETYLRKAF